MQAIDLTLQGTPNGGLTAFLISPTGTEAFPLTLPSALAAQHQAWLRRFLAHHDPAAAAVPADVVADYAARLNAALSQWLQQPEWEPLRRCLERLPGLPLRIRCQGTDPLIERLPWEELPLERPIWRLAGGAGSPTVPVRTTRRPRLLLLQGVEEELDLGAEIQRLERLARQGRIACTQLRGPASSLAELRRALADPRGWEALVFLGHSSADPQSGGRLQLGDGHWLSGHELARALEPAAQRGLALVLLNSCAGIDLARSCLAAGVPWALCFREVVPTRAASLAFCRLLEGMESGQPLSRALVAVRDQLRETGPAGCHLLLSAMASPAATDLRLPLTRRRQVQQRLAHSRRPQAIAAAALVVLAAAADLLPAAPLPAYALDRRLDAQRLWRRFTRQSGPTAAPIPVLLLDRHRSLAALAVQPTPGRTPRAALAEVLRRTPPEAVPTVALDVVLDEPAPHTAELAEVIRRQQPRRVIAGWLGPESDAPRTGVGVRSQPLQVLQAAGLEAFDLGVGTPTGAGGAKAPPLRLLWEVNGASFAGALSGQPAPRLPADSVIDWSIDWAPLLRLITPAELPGLNARALLVGSDGSLDGDAADLFVAPAALRPLLPRWGGASDVVPGALVQAVLAQSLVLGHWLTPLSLAATTALAAGLGVLVAAAASSRQRRLFVVLAIAELTVPLCLQLAVSTRWLVPIALPLLALSTTALLRRD